MSKIRLHGSSSGYMEIAPPAAGSSATVTLPNSAGEILLSDGSAASLTQIPAANIVGLATAGFERSGGFGGGKVLQIQQTVKTDTASESVSSGVPTSTIFLPVNITPASASNKILIMVTANLSDNGTCAIIIQKDGSALSGATGDAAGNRERTTASTLITSDNQLQTVNATYLDTAGTTSQITYGFKLFVQDNNTSTIYLNRMVNSYDYAYGFRSPSMIQVMEIAA